MSSISKTRRIVDADGDPVSSKTPPEMTWFRVEIMFFENEQ
jgi:hypothetical protein